MGKRQRKKESERVSTVHVSVWVCVCVCVGHSLRLLNTVIVPQLTLPLCSISHSAFLMFCWTLCFLRLGYTYKDSFLNPTQSWFKWFSLNLNLSYYSKPRLNSILLHQNFKLQFRVCSSWNFKLTLEVVKLLKMSAFLWWIEKNRTSSSEKVKVQTKPSWVLWCVSSFFHSSW